VGNFYDLGIARVMTYIAKSPTLVSLPDIGVGALRILKALSRLADRRDPIFTRNDDGSGYRQFCRCIGLAKLPAA
jgi:hypothetical protein